MWYWEARIVVEVVGRDMRLDGRVVYRVFSGAAQECCSDGARRAASGWVSRQVTLQTSTTQRVVDTSTHVWRGETQ